MFSFAEGFLFGKPASAAAAGAGGRDKDPMKEQVKAWKSGLTKEMRAIDRQIRDIDRSVEKVTKEIRALMQKTGQERNVRTLAGQIAKARQTTEQLAMSKAHINSVAMQLTEQAAMLRVSGVLGKSAQLLKGMSAIINAPQISENIRAMGAEMEKAGIIGEVMNETMEEAMPVEETDVDAVVEDILFEVTAGKLGVALPTRVHAAAARAEEEGGGEERTAELAGGDAAAAARFNNL